MPDDLVIAAKCAPRRELLQSVEASGIEAVELYLSGELTADPGAIGKACRGFPFRYALHAPKDEFAPGKLASLAADLGAEVVVFHDILWESEWEAVAAAFKNVKAKVCIENISDVDEPLKFMRRYGFGRCLDLEHIQMQCAGVYEEEFAALIRQASHIHLTGYKYGSRNWHTHIHKDQRHGMYFLKLIKSCGYSGMVVSEARTSLQTAGEFKKLKIFFDKFKKEG